MVATMSVNPVLTTNAAGLFSIDSLGWVAGTALNAPEVLPKLASGVLATAETLPMWGGIAIFEDIKTLTTYNQPNLGNVVGRATTVDVTSDTGIAGFSVFDQAHHMVTSPQSTVPLALSGMSVHYYRLGSGARIAVACDPSLVSLQGGSVGQQVSWDFTNQVLQPYVASGGTYSITSLTWAATNGGRITVVAAAAVPFGLGDYVTISGATNTGTGGAAAVNKTFVIDTYTDTTHFTLAAPAAAGVIGTIAGTILANAGIGALNVKVLSVDVGHSLTVSYDSTTGFATWNPTGTAAVILL